MSDMDDPTQSGYVTTPLEEAIALASAHAKETDGVWVFRFEDFNIVAANRKELSQRLVEAITYKREFESRPPMIVPPPPTQEEVFELAIKFGMQSPEFMEAAGALMTAGLRASRDKRLKRKMGSE